MLQRFFIKTIAVFAFPFRLHGGHVRLADGCVHIGLLTVKKSDANAGCYKNGLFGQRKRLGDERQQVFRYG